MATKKSTPPPTPPGRPRSEIPNSHIVSAARQFLEAAERLMPPGCMTCPLPMMLSASLAIELFLKSLDSHSEYRPLAGFPNGYVVTAKAAQHEHLLAKLYEGLDITIQSAMAASYTASPVVRGASTIRKALEEFNDLFVYSRYPFEGQYTDRKNRDVSSLIALAEFLAAFVDRMERRVTW